MVSRKRRAAPESETDDKSKRDSFYYIALALIVGVFFTVLPFWLAAVLYAWRLFWRLLP